MPEPRKNKFSFTDSRVERIKPDRTRRSYYDTKCPRLELRVSPSGYKVFSVTYSRGGRKRIGLFPAVTVKLARKVANEKRVWLELGVNPVQRETLQEAWEKYRQNMLDRGCSMATVVMFGRCFRRLEPWKHLRIEQLRGDMVVELQGKLKRAGMSDLANNTLKLLRAMVNFAIRRGWRGISPTQGIRELDRRVRTRFIEPHELGGFISALEERQDVFGDLILVALFTGARRSTVEQARWAEVDLRGRTWEFIGKGGKSCKVYLSRYVVEVFMRRKRQSRPEAEFVFENPFSEKPLGWVRRVLYRAELAARGLPLETDYLSIRNEFSMHTLRHSFITYGLRAGVAVQVLQAMVGHTVDRRITVRVYGHTTEEWKREGFQKVADLLLELAREGRNELPLSLRLMGLECSTTTPLQSEAMPAPTDAASSEWLPLRKETLVEQKTAVLKYFRQRKAAANLSSGTASLTEGVETHGARESDIA